MSTANYFYEIINLIQENFIVSLLLEALIVQMAIVIIYKTGLFIVDKFYLLYSLFLMIHYDGWNAYLISHELQRIKEEFPGDETDDETDDEDNGNW